MQQFHLTLRNEKLKFYSRLNGFIITIHIIVFFYLAIFANERNIRVAAVITLILLAACVFLKFYYRNIKWEIGSHPFFLFILIGWISMGKYWLAVIPFLFDIMSAITVRKLSVTCSKSSIVYPSFPKKYIQWNELNNVMLKDGLLTIDFRNNKFIQQFIDEAGTTVNEQEFNDFCSQQLNK